MTNKIPKKLMREFERVIFGKDIDADIHDLEDVINFAAEWCRNTKSHFEIQRDKDWEAWIVIARNYHISHHKNLSRAIMTAVVAAAKESKEAGR